MEQAWDFGSQAPGWLIRHTYFIALRSTQIAGKALCVCVCVSGGWVSGGFDLHLNQLTKRPPCTSVGAAAVPNPVRASVEEEGR